MGRDRFVRPESVTLQLSDGDWIIVKRRLTAGETRDLYAKMYVEANDESGLEGPGKIRLEPRQVGLAIVVAYLIDWSLEHNGARVPIRMLPIAEVETTLLALEYESFQEIRKAVEAHEEREDAARAAQKKTSTGEPPSVPISDSLDCSDGGMSGLETSTPMSAISFTKT